MKGSQVSPDFPDAFYRVAVKGLCVRDGKVLMVHDFTGRSDVDPSPEWELPGGGLDFGESFQDGLKREIQEEMGLKVMWIDEKPSYAWTTKREVSRAMEWYYVCTLIFRFEAEDLNFTPSEECKEIRFFSKEEMKENINDIAIQIKPLADKFNPSDFN